MKCVVNISLRSEPFLRCGTMQARYTPTAVLSVYDVCGARQNG